MNLFKKVEDYKSDFTTFPRTFEGYKWYKPIIILGLAIILYFALLCGIILIAKSFIGNSDFLLSSGQSQNFDEAGIFSSLIIILIIPSIYIPSKLLRERPFSSYLSLRGWNWSVFTKSTLITLIVFSLITLIQILIDGKQGESTFTIITFILCLIITPFQCFAEEYLCRGFLMQAFGSWFKIPIIAIIIQAAIFTVLHEYNLLGLLGILITGLTFGFMTWYTKGLEVSSAMHSINNLFAFSMTGFGFATATTEITPIDFTISISMLIISVILIIILDKKFNWFEFEN